MEESRRYQVVEKTDEPPLSEYNLSMSQPVRCEVRAIDLKNRET